MSSIPSNQAERIIKKFGNARALSRALQALGDPKKSRSPAVIYRWTYPRSRGGTAGRIPSNALDDVLAAARLEGIFITPEDLFGENEQ